jgi:hypothetical protein
LRFLQNIKDAILSILPTKFANSSFVFPYSEDIETKRQQIWSNLQKGILFEDTGLLIPWSTTFTKINDLAEQRRDSGDRTNWLLGEHEILDGYICNVALMKWKFINYSNPFSEIEVWLGFDKEGNEQFMFLKNKLTELLGEPSALKLEKFGDFDIGSIEWLNQKVKITLSGIEQFAFKYRLYVGLAENRNSL